MLGYNCDREGTHFVAVNSRGTTKKCSNCGVSTDKPLWVREHSCPSCGFETDRDLNAALNILSRGLDRVGVRPLGLGDGQLALKSGTVNLSDGRSSAEFRPEEESHGQAHEFTRG